MLLCGYIDLLHSFNFIVGGEQAVYALEFLPVFANEIEEALFI